MPANDSTPGADPTSPGQGDPAAPGLQAAATTESVTTGKSGKSRTAAKRGPKGDSAADEAAAAKPKTDAAPGGAAEAGNGKSANADRQRSAGRPAQQGAKDEAKSESPAPKAAEAADSPKPTGTSDKADEAGKKADAAKPDKAPPAGTAARDKPAAGKDAAERKVAEAPSAKPDKPAEAKAGGGANERSGKPADAPAPAETAAAAAPAARQTAAESGSAAVAKIERPAQDRSAPTPAIDENDEAAPVLKPEEVIDDKRDDWQVPPSAIDFENPLVSCLSTLAGLQQRPISTEALKAGLPQTGEDFTPDLAVRAAERAGLHAGILRRPKIRKILPVILPCILLLKESNACILTRYVDKQNVEILLPEGGGAKTVALDTLQEQYTGYAIFARPDFKFDDRAADIRLADSRAWFWGTLAKFWPIYSHVVIASVLINCFAIASPLFIMNVYDRVVPNNALETLWVLALGVGTVFAFEFLMRNLRTYFVDIAGKNADVIIASRMLEQVMDMRLDNKPASTGALANNMREFESLREFFTSGTLVAFVDLPFVLLFVGVIWIVAGEVAWVPLCAVPIVITVGLIMQYPLRKVIEDTHRESSQKHALLVETIDGLETIKATAAEGRVQRSWERFVGLTAESSGRARFISSFATTFAQIAIQASTVIVVVYGVHLIADGLITMGALVAATILTGRSLAPLGAVAAMLTRLQQSRVALKAIDTIMKTPVERGGGQRFLHRPEIEGKIEFKKVSFKYPAQENNALEEMSFTITPGERVGILGRIGSGKSTIARLLMGLYQPQEGAVLIDGTDLRQIDPADLRRGIGYVSQDNYLFFGSVRDNIAFGSPHLDDRTIQRAADVAGVTDFLRTHPHGFDLQVGERGMGLSGGQSKAIVAARAFLLDPPVLLLDEPTSCMDNSSEVILKRRLTEALGGKTLVLVTHRGSMLTLVDRLIIVDGGKVMADGPKDDVLRSLKQGQIRAAAS